jgi:DNA-directed RNA polymerase specialized sigma24 family protein
MSNLALRYSDSDLEELIDSLTPTQRDVFTLIAHDQTLEDMSQLLGVTHRQVRQVISALYARLGLTQDPGSLIRKLYPLAVSEGLLD